jgi:hypothetical protein
MRLDTNIRAQLVDRLLIGLAEAAPGSSVALRGSLAERRADQYSDIDLLWEVPDAIFPTCVDRVSAILTAIHPVESIRFDPDFQNSRKRRLIFARFAGILLFWRLDLDLLATSVQRDSSYDIANSHARGSVWSPAESALANAVGALKAHLREDDEAARQLLIRAFGRVGLPLQQPDLQTMILDLVAAVPALDPATANFAERIGRLVAEVFADTLL